MIFHGPKPGVPFFSLNASRLDPTEAEEAQCDALISLSVDGSRSVAKTWHRWVDRGRCVVLDPVVGQRWIHEKCVGICRNLQESAGICRNM